MQFETKLKNEELRTLQHKLSNPDSAAHFVQLVVSHMGVPRLDGGANPDSGSKMVLQLLNINERHNSKDSSDSSVFTTLLSPAGAPESSQAAPSIYLLANESESIQKLELLVSNLTNAFEYHQRCANIVEKALQAARAQLEQKAAIINMDTETASLTGTPKYINQSNEKRGVTQPPSNPKDHDNFENEASFSFHPVDKNAELLKLADRVENMIFNLQDADFEGKPIPDQHTLALQGLVDTFNNYRVQGASSVTMVNLQKAAEMLSLMEREIYGTTVPMNKPVVRPPPPTYMSNCY